MSAPAFAAKGKAKAKSECSMKGTDRSGYNVVDKSGKPCKG